MPGQSIRVTARRLYARRIHVDWTIAAAERLNRRSRLGRGARGWPLSIPPAASPYTGIWTTVLALRWVEIVSGTSFLLKYTFDSALSTALRSYFTTSKRR